MTVVVGLVGSAAGGLEEIRPGLVEPLLSRGFDVTVTLTPAAAAWLTADGEVEKLADLTGHRVRWEPRLPGEASSHPKSDIWVAAPATANTVAKLALGIADNQALTVLCENIGTTTPMIIFPRINAAHARQPAWEAHVASLRRAGTRLVYGEDVWPLYEPRRAPPNRELPWPAILSIVEALTNN